MPKVSKKLERLSRAMAYQSYVKNGMLSIRGADYVHDLVEERWSMFLDEAKDLNYYLVLVNDHDLSGFYFEN